MPMVGDESPKFRLVIRNPISNLNIVLDIYKLDESHTDKQCSTQRLFPFEKYPTFILPAILLLLLLEAGKG